MDQVHYHPEDPGDAMPGADCDDCTAPLPKVVGLVKPRVQLTGTDGNVFALIGQCSRGLRRAGLPDLASEMTARCFKAHSYDEALQIMQEYVEAD